MEVNSQTIPTPVKGKSIFLVIKIISLFVIVFIAQYVSLYMDALDGRHSHQYALYGFLFALLLVGTILIFGAQNSIRIMMAFALSLPVATILYALTPWAYRAGTGFTFIFAVAATFVIIVAAIVAGSVSILIARAMRKVFPSLFPERVNLSIISTGIVGVLILLELILLSHHPVQQFLDQHIQTEINRR